MKRFFYLLFHEIMLFRTNLAIHLVAVLQPFIFLIAMSSVLVHPTFDMKIEESDSRYFTSFIQAMKSIKSPIGSDYIRPEIKPRDSKYDDQMIRLENRGRKLTAVQYYGLIDSNLVKNFRNRLKAVVLYLWNKDLGNRSVSIVEKPLFPRDLSYIIYYGLAFISMAAFIASVFIGSVLTTQDFENRHILEYRLSPVNSLLSLIARFIKLCFFSLLGSGLIIISTGIMTGRWPDNIFFVLFIIILLSIIAGAVGMTAGLVFKRMIPAFVVGLTTGFTGWILGDAFGLASGFSGIYYALSRFMPHSYATELIFPQYFGIHLATEKNSFIILIIITVISFTGCCIAYVTQVRNRR
ncbi:MAG: hypothetical protein JXB88_02100 [Spirochaetales bacterium]|nr:hypothetical protein [Spirochaetales bacterium]